MILPPATDRARRHRFRQRLRATSEALKASALDCVFVDEYESASELFGRTVALGRTVFVVGNGGSSAQAAHLVGELLGRFEREREGLSAVDLTADSATLTALINDYDPLNLFSRQVRARCRAGDLLVCLSTSGKSLNVIRAAIEARNMGVGVLSITGICDSLLEDASDAHIHIPYESTPLIQEVTLCILHALCADIDHAET